MNVNPLAHIKAFEAKVRKQNREYEKLRMKEIKAEHNIRTVFVGDYTICYRVDRRNVIELSTAIKHPNDRFDRHLGETTALIKFCEANRIVVKNRHKISAKQFIQMMFTGL